jgi:hypothetical protein
LARGEMAEPADLLFFVQSVGGHFHAADERSELASLSLSLPPQSLKQLGKVEAPTEQKPYHNTSASTPSSSYRGYKAGDPARKSQTTHLRGEPGTACRLPVFHSHQ